MKLLALLKSETSRMLMVGFAVGATGLFLAQPGTAQVDQQPLSVAAVQTR